MPSITVRPAVPAVAIDIRRGPLGRWIPVPWGSPADARELGAETLALSGILDPILERHRAAKNLRYEARKNDPSYKGPRIVAEGDSWFEYPHNDDLIMVLGEKYAIMSLAKAGDDWMDIYTRAELFPAIDDEKPDIVMLSLGGNEVMGSIETYVREYQHGRPMADHILPSFGELIRWVERQYDSTIEPILSEGAQVILHGYDYPDARDVGTDGAQWIGPPLQTMRNIGAVAYWREIANLMLDRFNEMLSRVASKPAHAGKVHYVNLRGTIGNPNFNHGPDTSLWTDEIHATGPGFRKLAAKLDAKIRQIAAVA